MPVSSMYKIEVSLSRNLFKHDNQYKQVQACINAAWKLCYAKFKANSFMQFPGKISFSFPLKH